MRTNIFLFYFQIWLVAWKSSKNRWKISHFHIWLNRFHFSKLEKIHCVENEHFSTNFDRFGGKLVKKFLFSYMAQSIPFSWIEKNRYDENEHFSDQYRPIWWEIRENWSKNLRFHIWVNRFHFLDRKTPSWWKWTFFDQFRPIWGELVKKICVFTYNSIDSIF